MAEQAASAANLRVRVNPDDLRTTVQKILMNVGVPADDALTGADVLVKADMMGVESHGVSNMLERYVERFQADIMNPKPDWARRAGDARHRDHRRRPRPGRGHHPQGHGNRHRKGQERRRRDGNRGEYAAPRHGRLSRDDGTGTRYDRRLHVQRSPDGASFAWQHGPAGHQPHRRGRTRRGHILLSSSTPPPASSQTTRWTSSDGSAAISSPAGLATRTERLSWRPCPRRRATATSCFL